MLITVFGKRGSGKTTAIRAMIEELPKPVVIVDILGNFEPGKGENPDDWVETDSASEAIQQMAAYLDDPKGHRGILVVRDASVSRVVDFVSSALWSARGGTLVLDEADSVDLSDAPCFDELVRYGRNRGIWLITGCRRPAEISKNITAGADLVYCFRTHEPRDLEYFEKAFGWEIVEPMMSLPHWHGIYVDYKAQESGTFKTDEQGVIHRLSSRSLLAEGGSRSGRKRSQDPHQETLPLEESDERSESLPDPSENEDQNKSDK